MRCFYVLRLELYRAIDVLNAPHTPQRGHRTDGSAAAGHLWQLGPIVDQVSH
jgi:hypothetical protein